MIRTMTRHQDAAPNATVDPTDAMVLV